MPKLERIATTETIASLVPTDEQLAALILNPGRIESKGEERKMSSLVSRALPK